MFNKNSLHRPQTLGGELPQQFRGIAAILAEKADLSGQHTMHYNVPAHPGGKSSQIDSYRLCVGFSTKIREFSIIQTFPNKPYRNSFSVSADGEVTAFCDHMPGTSFVDAILKGELPTSLEPFDIKFSQEENPVQFVKTIAEQAVRDLQLRGVLDKNLNPANDRRDQGSR